MSTMLPLPENHKNWQASIDIRFTRQATKTVMASLKHAGPLRVQRPFYPEQEVCHVYLLHPPGGVVGGDTLDINIHTDKHAHALMTTPGSSKFYRSAGDTAQVKQTLVLQPDSVLEWFPQENILFPGAKVNLQTHIHLHGNAQITAWDISCLGRPVNQESFEFGRMNSVLRVYRENVPLLIERQRVINKQQLTASAGLRGFPMNGIFLCSGCDLTHVEDARSVVTKIKPGFPAAVTLLDDLLVLRVLGHQTQSIQQIMIAVWQMLRPKVNKKAAVLPRIWST